MTFSLWFIFLINVDQLFPIVQVVDIYTQLSTGYLYASNRVPISGYHGHNGEQFAQWCTSWLHSSAATSSWSLGRPRQKHNQVSTLTLFGNKYQRIMIQSLVQNFIVPLLLSTLIYFYLPTPETNLLGEFLCLKWICWWKFWLFLSSYLPIQW